MHVAARVRLERSRASRPRSRAPSRYALRRGHARRGDRGRLRAPARERGARADRRARGGGARAPARALAHEPSRGRVIRIHGNLHLGDLLWTGSRLARARLRGHARPQLRRAPPQALAAARRREHAALVRLRRLGDRARGRRAAARGLGGAGARELPARLLLGRRAERPRARRRRPAPAQLLEIFELEKAVDELRHELEVRPEWVSIPVAAIERLLARAARRVVLPRGSAGHLRDRARRRRGQAPAAADARPRQARGAVRRQLPARRLRALEPRQRGLSQDRGADAVQEPQPRPPHHDDVAPLAAARQLRHARARAAAARAALVLRLGGRDLPEPQPDLRRAPRVRVRVRRRPHLPHGSGADGRPAHRHRRRRDRRRAARAAGRGEPLGRDRARRRRASASPPSARSRRTRRPIPRRPGRCSPRWATTSSRPRR